MDDQPPDPDTGPGAAAPFPADDPADAPAGGAAAEPGGGDAAPAPQADLAIERLQRARRRRRARRRERTRIRGLAAALVVAVVVVLGLLAANSVGLRPTLGPAVTPSGAGTGGGSSGGTGGGTNGGTGTGTTPGAPSAGCATPTELLPRAPGSTSTLLVAVPRGTRTVRVTEPLVRPDGAAAPAPLVLGLPGFGQDAAAFAAAGGLEAALPEFLVATLEPEPAGAELNVAADTRRADDILASVLAVEQLWATRCVDRWRTSSVGFGPGGQLAGVLACIRPEFFAAAVAVHGAFLPDPCRLDPAVSFLGVWAADDDVLPLGGGYGVGLPRVAPEVPGAPPVLRVPAEPADAVTARWAELIGATDRSAGELGDRSVTTTFSGGRDGTVAEQWVRAGRGHGWTDDDTAVVARFLRERVRPT